MDQISIPGRPVLGDAGTDKPTKNTKKASLEALNLPKEKIYGIIQGRICANGSKHRICFKDGDTVASLTVSTEVLFTTLVIGAYELIVYRIVMKNKISE